MSGITAYSVEDIYDYVQRVQNNTPNFSSFLFFIFFKKKKFFVIARGERIFLEVLGDRDIQ